MILSEESWYVVRNTPGVTGFVGMGNSPTLFVRRSLADHQADGSGSAADKVTFKAGERVRIVDGHSMIFAEPSLNRMERAKVRVMVNFFGLNAS